MSFDLMPTETQRALDKAHVDRRARLFNSPPPPPRPVPPRPLSPFARERIEAANKASVEATVKRYEVKPIINGATIIAEVAAKHEVTPEDITGRSHRTAHVLARREAAYRMVVELGMTNAETGRRLNRDHSTVLWAVRHYIRGNPHLRPVAERKIEVRDSLTEEVNKLYFDDGYTTTEIVRELDIDRNMVNSFIRAEVRRVREARRAGK